MQAGNLRHRVIIQTGTIARDAYGAEIPTWVTLATVWASVEDLSGREFWEAQKVNSEVTTKIRIRYRTGLRPDMRATLGARIFDILAVLDPDGKRRELHLMCQEWVL